MRIFTEYERQCVKAYAMYRLHIETNTCAYNTANEYQQMLAYILTRVGLISDQNCMIADRRAIFRKAFDIVTTDKLLSVLSQRYLRVLKLEQQYTMFCINYSTDTEYAKTLALQLEEEKASLCYTIVAQKGDVEVNESLCLEKDVV